MTDSRKSQTGAWQTTTAWRLVALCGCLVALALVGLEARQGGSSFAAVAASVRDGDTVDVKTAGRTERIRLYGIDAPEGGQPYSRQARSHLTSLLGSTRLTIVPVERDVHGRLVARIIANGNDVGLQMITAGYAWHYRQYSSDASYAQAERAARAARVGLWSAPSPVAPWDYRRQRQPAGPPSTGPFRGNTSSRVFHAPGCQYYRSRNCTEIFGTRASAEAAGYRPHTQCVR